MRATAAHAGVLRDHVLHCTVLTGRERVRGSGLGYRDISPIYTVHYECGRTVTKTENARGSRLAPDQPVHGMAHATNHASVRSRRGSGLKN